MKCLQIYNVSQDYADVNLQQLSSVIYISYIRVAKIVSWNGCILQVNDLLTNKVNLTMVNNYA